MVNDKPDPELLTALTTEHFVLQSARGNTTSEANGRAAIYLGALSSALIALGFVADEPETFRVFAAVVLPAMLLLGLFTFVRLVTTGVESVMYLVRIQRIRASYALLAPDGPWFADVRTPPAGGTEGETAAALESTGIRPGSLQMLYTAAAMVAAMNAIVAGAAVGLLLGGLSLPLPAAATLGVLAGLAGFIGQVVYERRQYLRNAG